MISYDKELVVNWGESDPFGLVYFPRILAWFNDTEHELFARLNYPVNKMIEENRSAFVMGKVAFEFVGPAAYGDRVRSTIKADKIGNSTIAWKCEAFNQTTSTLMATGMATRVYAKILEDGNLKAMPIPDDIRAFISKDSDELT